MKNLANSDTEDLVRRFYEELWNCWDDCAVAEVLAEDFTFRGSLGMTVQGRDEWRSYRDLVRAGASDFYNEVLTLVVQGEQAAVRLNYRGTHDGTLLGYPASGRSFSYAGAAFFVAAAGQLRSAWVLGDLASLRQQLSATS